MKSVCFAFMSMAVTTSAFVGNRRVHRRAGTGHTLFASKHQDSIARREIFLKAAGLTLSILPSTLLKPVNAEDGASLMEAPQSYSTTYNEGDFSFAAPSTWSRKPSGGFSDFRGDSVRLVNV